MPESRWYTSPPYHFDFRTRKGIQEGISSVVTTSDLLFQMTHGIVIDELTADRAKAMVVVNEIGRRGEAGFFVLGVSHDTITKDGGHWGFAERYFETHYIDRDLPRGDVTVDYKTRR